MGVVAFQVSTRSAGRKRTVQVRVYDTAKELREAGDRYNRQLGIDDASGDAVGLAQTFRSEKLVDDEWVQGPAVGIIRLTKDYLGSGVISHECLHVALRIYEQDYLEEHGPTFDDMANEEVLCHIESDLCSKIVNKLYDYKCIQ